MRKIVLTISLTFIIILTLCSCGVNSDSQISPPDICTESNCKGINEKDLFYPFEAGYKVVRMARSDSSLMIGGSAGFGDNKLFLAEYSVSDTNKINIKNKIEVELDDPETKVEETIYGICSDSEGTFYVLTGEAPALARDEKTGEATYNTEFAGNYAIIEYDKNGKFVEKKKFTYLSPENSTMRGVVVTDKTEFIVYTSTGYAYLDNEAHIINSYSDPDIQIFGVQNCNKGVIASIWNNGNSHHGACSLIISSDGSNKFMDFGASLSRCQSSDGELLLNDGVSFLNWNFDSNENVELINWNYGNKAGTSCTGVYQLRDNAFAYTMANCEYVTLLSHMEKSPGERSVVNVAIIDTDTAREKLIELNNSDCEYFYKIKEYTYEQLPRLTAEILAGDGPDLLLSNGNFDTSTDAFLDLYPFIDADPELERNSFIPNFLTAIENDGELHEIWTAFCINTLAARKSDIGDKKVLSIEDYNAVMQQNPDYVALFEPFITADWILSWISSVSSSEYIDEENKTCSFDEPSFYQLLSWCKEVAPEFKEGSSENDYDLSQTALAFESISAASNLPVIEQNLGPFSFVGFPSGDGKGNYFSAPYGCVAAIPATSNNKEGAWKYIRTQLLPKQQIDSYLADGFPVSYDAFIRAIKPETSELDCELLLRLVNDTYKAIQNGDKQLENIIVDSSKAYLAGDKSLDETVKIIQSKSSVYIAEKYG